MVNKDVELQKKTARTLLKGVVNPTVLNIIINCITLAYLGGKIEVLEENLFKTKHGRLHI